MSVQKPLIALISSGAEDYRRYLLQQLSGAYDVWLFIDEPVTWQQPFVSGVSKVENYEPATLLPALRHVAQGRDLRGLVCWDERYIIATADAAVQLGLPSAGSSGIRGCRDKALSRTLLSKAGLRQPRSELCSTLDEAVSSAWTLAFPLVVKPRGMGASIGVALVHDEAELRVRFTQAHEASFQGAEDFQGGVLLEEYVEGPEISVDGRVVGGEYHPLFVARKRVGLPPHFEELGHTVAHDDPLLVDGELLHTLAIAHQAIGFENGITHTELKMTAEGPVIIEMNGRLGGDLIPYLATLAIGFKPGQIAGRVACGDVEDEEDRPLRRAAAITFRYPDQDGVVADITLPEPVQQEGLSGSSVRLASPGARLALPPSAFACRAAYAIAEGEEAQACLTLSMRLASEVCIHVMEPVHPPALAANAELPA